VKMSKETPKRLEYELSCVIYIPFYRKTVKFREIKIQLGKKTTFTLLSRDLFHLANAPLLIRGLIFRSFLTGNFKAPS